MLAPAAPESRLLYNYPSVPAISTFASGKACRLGVCFELMVVRLYESSGPYWYLVVKFGHRSTLSKPFLEPHLITSVNIHYSGSTSSL